MPTTAQLSRHTKTAMAVMKVTCWFTAWATPLVNRVFMLFTKRSESRLCEATGAITD